MPAPKTFQVAGVDGCKAGWCVAVASAHQTGREGLGRTFKLETLFVRGTFADVLSKTQICKLVCVDIPIGLGEGNQPRECDTTARRLLGPRASTVFPAPVRPCLSADDYETACRIALEQSGKKLSRQSFGLVKKIRELDGLMTPELQERVREIHPEVSFWALNGSVSVLQSKKTVPGQARRRQLLQRVFINVDDILAGGAPGGYGPDDALDALVAVWTAAQAVSGKTSTLPENPVCDSSGLRMEILCPAV